MRKRVDRREAAGLNAEEVDVLQLFRSLAPADQAIVLEFAERVRQRR